MEKYKLANKKSTEKSKGLCTRLFTDQLKLAIAFIFGGIMYVYCKY